MKIVKSIAKVAVASSTALFACSLFAQLDLENQDNQISYSIGVNIGQSVLAQGLLEGIDREIFAVGLLDAVNGEPKMSDAEMIAAIQAFQSRLEQEQAAAVAAIAAQNETFFAENGSKAGVVSLASGMQYEVLTTGDAAGASPTTSDSVLAHYHGTLIDGSVFDSSVDRGQPAQFGVSQVIAGWTEALQLMKVGDKWRLFIPPNLAYGEASPTPAIPPNSALIFDVELLEIR